MVFALFLPAAYSSHQVEYRIPSSMTTTVGESTTLQIDIKNSGSTTEYYRVRITSSIPNEIGITNSDITTKLLAPSQSVSVFSNIITLTENDNLLTVQIYRDNDLSHAVSTTVNVKSKKFSLPEFGLIGFIQIIALAGILYFVFRKN